ncbi:MAG: hypothetical protein AAF611_06285 [Bacteroidota bacterium]
MRKKVYILRERKSDGSLHLFLADPTDQNTCQPQYYSICGQMTIEEEARTIFSCLSEERARKECAKIGRRMCSQCMSYLYRDEDL